MSQQNVLASGTGAGTSDPIFVSGAPVGVYAFGTLGANTGALQRYASDGSWVPVYLNGEAVALSATNPQVVIEGAGQYRVVFDARAAAIGVDIQTD